MFSQTPTMSSVLIKEFKKMRFSVIGWPGVFYLAELTGFNEHSVQINDPKGRQMFGTDAFFVSDDFISPAADELTFIRVSAPEVQMFQRLDGFADNMFPSPDGGAFISSEWLESFSQTPMHT